MGFSLCEGFQYKMQNGLKLSSRPSAMLNRFVGLCNSLRGQRRFGLLSELGKACGVLDGDV